MRNFDEPIFPSDIKKLNDQQLNELATSIREYLIDKISTTGGHLSSNLGIVELTIALHYVYNSPTDKLIFDVGHQTYVHKILTGRGHQISTLRQKDGLSGFIKYDESPHDVWEAGHSSTSLSAAAGFLEARKLNKDIGEVVVIIGDGAFQNGLSFSALNYLGAHPDQKVTIILNDNDMSISKNVGSLSKMFNKIRIKKPYRFFKYITPRFIRRLGSNLSNSIRTFVYGPNLFHSFGFTYYGPINGHNIAELTKFLEHARNKKESSIIHVKTIKGKGYEFAEADKIGLWHGVSPFDVTTGNSHRNSTNGFSSWSEGISTIVASFAKENANLKVVCPAMIAGSGWLEFQKELPEQIIDVGIAEELTVVMAAAMSRNGIIPICSIYSTFLQRAYDQINHDVCRNNNKVIFLIDRAGLVGADGDTHQGIFDIAFLSHLPNMKIAMPKDMTEAKSLIDYAININDGPIAIRYPRRMVKTTINEAPKITEPNWQIEISLQEVNIISYGPNVDDIKQYINEHNLEVGLINARFIRPLDVDILKKLHNTQLIIYEEVVKNGSLAALIASEIAFLNLSIQLTSFGIDDQYVEHGTILQLKEELGIDLNSLFKYINKKL